MKKKLLCLVIACAMLVSMLASCDQLASLLNGGKPAEAKTVWVYFYEEGGEFAEEGAEERECVIGEEIGALPSVSREGYKFLGWFADDERISKKTVVEGEMDVYAKWQKEGEEPTDKPNESKDTDTASPEEDQAARCAVGEHIPGEIDKTQSRAATCLNASITYRKCAFCKQVYLDESDVTEALGHDWGENEFGAGEIVHTCNRCWEIESVGTLTNILQGMEFQASGDDYYANDVKEINDGFRTTSSVSGQCKDGGHLCFTFYFDEETEVVQIALIGHTAWGSPGSYQCEVLYEFGGEWADLGTVNFYDYGEGETEAEARTPSGTIDGAIVGVRFTQLTGWNGCVTLDEVEAYVVGQ